VPDQEILKQPKEHEQVVFFLKPISESLVRPSPIPKASPEDPIRRSVGKGTEDGFEIAKDEVQSSVSEKGCDEARNFLVQRGRVPVYESERILIDVAGV